MGKFFNYCCSFVSSVSSHSAVVSGADGLLSIGGTSLLSGEGSSSSGNGDGVVSWEFNEVSQFG